MKQKRDRQILDDFGQRMMSHVRDGACDYLKRLLAGRMADTASRKLSRQSEALRLERTDVIERLVVSAVDATIAEFLDFIESEEIGIGFTDCNGNESNITAISDGLVGELYGDNGWIAKFSNFKNELH